MRRFLGSLFGKGHGPPKAQTGAGVAHRNTTQPKGHELYNKGDVIAGKYEIYEMLGKGGFGVVYLAYERGTGALVALKTFRDELLVDPMAREAFKKEAMLWVNLEEHPFILAARWAQVVFGRLFVQMDYIARDAQGRVNLADHLVKAGGPLDTTQALEWAIQFCLAMQHANAHGIACHRDIKPANILITQHGALKISDFGLAAAAEVAGRGSTTGSFLSANGGEAGLGFSLTQANGKVRCGTPGYMAPEVYSFEGADVRSDIYSFGLVLWQIAAGSPVPPFTVQWRGDMESFLHGIYEQQIVGRVPSVEGPLKPVIERCLKPRPSDRYGSCAELRAALDSIYERRLGRKFELPELGKKTADSWNQKGGSLAALGRQEEAIACYDKALAIDPRHPLGWANKGVSLHALGRHEEAIDCYDRALSIVPTYA